MATADDCDDTVPNKWAFAPGLATCATDSTYRVIGTVHGLSEGESVTLTNNGSETLNVSADGAFVFPTALNDGAQYDVAVTASPVGLICTVSANLGVVQAADVADVAVRCTAIVDSCDPNPCQNDGSCVADDSEDGFTCTCAAGYSGDTCLTNIDDCDPNPCENGGICAGGLDDFTCTCAVGYSGETCLTNIDDCDPNPCQNGGACADGVDDFTCTCAVGFNGDFCEIASCDPNPCLNGSSRAEGACICASGYSGDLCQTEIDECLNAPCPAGTACIDGLGAYTCGVSVSAGRQFTCPVLDGGDAKCWGANASGKLGQGDANARGDSQMSEMGDALPFIDVGTGRTLTQIRTSGFNTCAVRDDGSVVCWGDGNLGTLGTENFECNLGLEPGSMGDSLTAVSLGTGRTALSVHVGLYFACALLDNNTVKCWGGNDWGQLSQGSTDALGQQPGELGDALPAVDLPQTNVTALSVGSFFACAIAGDTPPRVYCWGDNTSGQLGIDTVDNIGDGSGEMGAMLQALPAFGADPVELSCGSEHCCARQTNGAVACWGANWNGQLGRGDLDTVGDDDTPGVAGISDVSLGTGLTATAIAAGSYHTCALLNDGTIKCWGTPADGRLGYGSTFVIGDDLADMGDALDVVPLGTTETGVSAGGEQTCALLTGGGVRCWGAGRGGQLGYDSEENVGDQFGEVALLSDIALGTGVSAVQISAGWSTTCVVTSDGRAKCWGGNGSGQLGLETQNSRGDGPGDLGSALAAFDIGTGRITASISAGDEHACAILDEAPRNVGVQIGAAFWGKGTALIGVIRPTPWATPSRRSTCRQRC